MLYNNYIFDEIYQAALEAGSGGIRYNDTLKYIQLMDENKNWVNYKRFNAYSEQRLCTVMDVTTSSSGNFNYTFDANGIYLLITAGGALSAGMINSINTTATKKDIIAQNTTVGSNNIYYNLMRFIATVGDTLSINFYTSAYTATAALFFISGAFTDVELIDSSYAQSNLTKSFTNASDRIIIAASGGINKIINVQTELNNYISDFSRYALVTSIAQTGSATVTVNSASYGGQIIAVLQAV